MMRHFVVERWWFEEVLISEAAVYDLFVCMIDLHVCRKMMRWMAVCVRAEIGALSVHRPTFCILTLFKGLPCRKWNRTVSDISDILRLRWNNDPWLFVLFFIHCGEMFNLFERSVGTWPLLSKSRRWSLQISGLFSCIARLTLAFF